MRAPTGAVIGHHDGHSERDVDRILTRAAEQESDCLAPTKGKRR